MKFRLCVAWQGVAGMDPRHKRFTEILEMIGWIYCCRLHVRGSEDWLFGRWELLCKSGRLCSDTVAAYRRDHTPKLLLSTLSLWILLLRIFPIDFMIIQPFGSALQIVCPAHDCPASVSLHHLAAEPHSLLGIKFISELHRHYHFRTTHSLSTTGLYAATAGPE